MWAWRLQLEAELEGRLADACELLLAELPRTLDSQSSSALAEALCDLATYTLATGDHGPALRAVELMDALPSIEHNRMLDSQLHRLRANAAAAAGDDDGAAEHFAIALANARNLGFAYWLAAVLADYGAWLVDRGREQEAAPLVAEARALYEEMGATRCCAGSTGSHRLRCRWPRRRHDLRGLRNRQRGRAQVLPRVRRAACARPCPACGAGNPPAAKFCGDCGTRPRRGRDVTACRAGRASGRAAPRVRPLRRPRRLHHGLGGARRRGHAGAADALLRCRTHDHRALRRDGREVHRRRGHGRVGRAGGPGGRRRAGRPRRARPRRGGARARPRPPSAGGGVDRRGRGHARRTGRRHGRGRPRQHRLARAVGRRARNGARRRGDAAIERSGHRVRGRRHARAQGQGGRSAALARAAGYGRTGRRAQVDVARAAVRRAPPRAAPREGALPRRRRRAEGAGRLRRRHRRNRQVEARVGVLQVHRRPAGDDLLAPRPLPRLRRGRDLLGAGRDGADARRNRRGRGPGIGAGEAACLDRRARGRRGGARVGRAAPRPPARTRGHDRSRPRRPLRRLAPFLRAPGR